MINKSIRKALIRNLFLGAGIISIIMGSIVGLVEYQRLGSHVEKLATESLDKYSQYYREYYSNQSDSTIKKLREALLKILVQDRFILIEFYDSDIKRVIVEYTKDIDQLKLGLLDKFSKYDFNGKDSTETIYSNEQLYLKLMLPVKEPGNDRTIGHFVGIYHVTNEQVTDIQQESMLLVAGSVLVVLLTALLLYPAISSLSQMLLTRSDELMQANVDMIKTLGSAIAKRDSDTNSHNYRVTIYAVRLAESLGIPTSQIRSLIKGSFLHDVGKIGISDAILLKPGKLSKIEFEIMKQHVTLGEDIIENNKWLKDAADVVMYHHEKFDGSGYMAGLKGEDIPINAMIFAIVDVFDALTCSRPYKEAFSLEHTMTILSQGRGSHFNPEFLTVFEKISAELYTQVCSYEKEKKLTTHLDQITRKYFL